MKNTGTTYSNSNVNSHNAKTLLIGGRKIIWYDLDITASTMDHALRMVKGGCKPWTVVSAENQTSGRGTHGRTWFSPGGKGLWISVILPPPHKAEYLSNLSVLAARALIKVLENLTTKPRILVNYLFSSFILQPSSFILSPSAFIFQA
ncbi:MAG TPA: hypothetical protein ENH82_20590, partial [bacterium]|nr:hypothetical protein [bacterium]